jgi:hypothetical protein
MGMPSRIRFRAPTDGLDEFDSINEIVEFVTPVRLASSRWERLCMSRKWRRRVPMSTDIIYPFRLFEISQT